MARVSGEHLGGDALTDEDIKQAKDGSAGFDFEGTYIRIVPEKIVEYRLGDGRDVKIEFTEGADGVLVRETFEAESRNDRELQRRGWQAILTISPGMLKQRTARRFYLEEDPPVPRRVRPAS
jgi:uncharacterized protein YndB with AHSA1/START domain